MTFDIAEYKKLYIVTARELVAKMQTQLVELKRDPTNMIALKECFIAAHSFKSQSLVMGYAHVGMAGKHLEHLFRDAINGQCQIGLEHTAHIERILGLFMQAIDQIERGEGELDLTNEMNHLEQYIKTCSP